MSDWQVVGRQKFRVVDDMVQWDVLAEVEVPELSRVLQACVEVQAAHGYTLLLVTAHGGAWSFPPEARKCLAQFHLQHKSAGATALVGASPAATVLIDLVLRAVALVNGHRPATRYFRSGADALEWLQVQRARGKQGLLKRP